MKRLASITTGLCLAAALCFGIARPAAAQAQFNCAMLSGTPYMCVKNASAVPVVAVQAVAPGFGWFNPTAWISIPGGGIMPGGAAVVRFPTYSHGDVQNIVVRTADGVPHYIWNVNVRSNTSITIPNHW